MNIKRIYFDAKKIFALDYWNDPIRSAEGTDDRRWEMTAEILRVVTDRDVYKCKDGRFLYSPTATGWVECPALWESYDALREVEDWMDTIDDGVIKHAVISPYIDRLSCLYPDLREEYSVMRADKEQRFKAAHAVLCGGKKSNDH